MLYKYRSLTDLKKFIDILINKRLYASNYMDLNDPMEGAFCYSPNIEYKKIAKLIREEKEKTLICSLSRNYKNGLMWSVYADQHKGCCIEVEANSTLWNRVEIDYSENMLNLENVLKENIDINRILGYKSVQWQHEEEVRYLRTINSNRSSHYLPVKINRVYLGVRVSPKDERFIRKLIENIDNSIEVVKLKKDDIDFGFNSIE